MSKIGSHFLDNLLVQDLFQLLSPWFTKSFSRSILVMCLLPPTYPPDYGFQVWVDLMLILPSLFFVYFPRIVISPSGDLGGVVNVTSVPVVSDNPLGVIRCVSSSFVVNQCAD